MNIDAKVSQDLIQTLEDGKKGFADAADKLDDTNRSDIASKFRDYSSQRSQFASELRGIAGGKGVDMGQPGTAAAAVHRGWMAIKDVLSGSNAQGVLDAAEQGEDHAVSEYERALENTDISIDLRTVIERQFSAVQAAHDEVRSLRDSNS
jgi:uncharacterized protein (TIGR02284 family)